MKYYQVVNYSQRKISENHRSGNTDSCLITYGGLLPTCTILIPHISNPWVTMCTCMVGEGGAGSSLQPPLLREQKSSANKQEEKQQQCPGIRSRKSPCHWFSCALHAEELGLPALRGGGRERWRNSADAVWNNQMWNFKAWTGVDISECTFVWVSALQSLKIKVRFWGGREVCLLKN